MKRYLFAIFLSLCRLCALKNSRDAELIFIKSATDNFKNKLSNRLNVPLGQRILTQNLYEDMYAEVRVFSSP